jgi:hypothetical protein
MPPLVLHYSPVSESFDWLAFSGRDDDLFRRPSINRSSSAISSGLLCFSPLWISSSLCINSAKFSITSSKAWEGWLAETIGHSKDKSWSKVNIILRALRPSADGWRNIPISLLAPQFWIALQAERLEGL